MVTLLTALVVAVLNTLALRHAYRLGVRDGRAQAARTWRPHGAFPVLDPPRERE